MSKAQTAKKPQQPKAMSKKMTIRDLIKEKKGQAVDIALLDTKDVHGTVVSVHADFFVLSVGDVKEEHIIPLTSVAQIRPPAEPRVEQLIKPQPKRSR